MDTTSDQGRFLVGSFFLGLVVVMWVSASFITNALFTSMTYNKPFLMTYVQTSTFSIYLLWPLCEYMRRRRRGIVLPDDDYVDGDRLAIGSQPVAGHTVDTHTAAEAEAQAEAQAQAEADEAQIREAPVAHTKLSVWETGKVAMIFCPVWFLANWTSNAALAYTSVSSGTMLSSMSGLFTLVLGTLLGVEKVTAIRILSVAASLGGVVLVSSDSYGGLGGAVGGSAAPLGKPTNPVLGDALSLGSALCYAVYVLLLKVRLEDESRVSMTLFFGFVGLVNLVCCWPLVLLLHVLGWETLAAPPNASAVLCIAMNAAITFLSDFVYLRAMLMTSPLTVTLGITMTIPLSMVGDLVRGTWYAGAPFVVGAMCVFLGFAAHGYADWSDLRENDGDVDTERRHLIRST